MPAGLFLCVASATWGDAGAFSPFYRIAGVLDRAAYDISLEEAANGSRFWLEPQTWHFQPSRGNTRWRSCAYDVGSSRTRGCFGTERLTMLSLGIDIQ